MERADSVRLLSLNPDLRSTSNHARTEAALTDANDDDEVHSINSGKENQENAFISTSNSKPGLLPDAHITAFNNKLNLGLPQQGTFSDPHDGQKDEAGVDRKSTVSSQKDFRTANIFQKSSTGGPTASFEPISAANTDFSSAFVDHQAAKPIDKEQV